jgi:hypothetical protein
LQEAAALKESLVDYSGGVGSSEAYQWKRKLRGAGRSPELSSDRKNLFLLSFNRAEKDRAAPFGYLIQ